MEGIGGIVEFADLIAYIVLIIGFFMANKYSQDRNSERQVEATARLCELIVGLQDDLKEARASGSKEHQTMIDTLSENQKVMINTMNETNKAMAEEHKDMIKISGKQNELLVKIEANLMSHMAEERK